MLEPRNPERVFGGRTLAVRVVAQPFRSSKSIAGDLQVGLAFTSSDVGVGLRSLRGLTTFEETLLRSRSLGAGAPAAGRVRAALEARTLLVQVGIHPRDH